MSQQQEQFTQMVGKLIGMAGGLGLGLTFGEAWRPQWVASEYEKRGIGKKNSFHIRRLAVDFNLFKNGVWLKASEDHAPLGEYWESIGGTWGGRFKKADGNHYSLGEG